MAVTNESGQVRNVSGLRVVDASIFPTVPCANTNFPTMMVAEKIADDILNCQRQPIDQAKCVTTAALFEETEMTAAEADFQPSVP
jgi:choline dehydrogenase-like flavoprotein